MLAKLYNYIIITRCCFVLQFDWLIFNIFCSISDPIMSRVLKYNLLLIWQTWSFLVKWFIILKQSFLGAFYGRMLEPPQLCLKVVLDVWSKLWVVIWFGWSLFWCVKLLGELLLYSHFLPINYWSTSLISSLLNDIMRPPQSTILSLTCTVRVLELNTLVCTFVNKKQPFVLIQTKKGILSIWSELVVCLSTRRSWGEHIMSGHQLYIFNINRMN